MCLFGKQTYHSLRDSFLQPSAFNGISKKQEISLKFFASHTHSPSKFSGQEAAPRDVSYCYVKCMVTRDRLTGNTKQGATSIVKFGFH
jgi:hypothetical protein